MNEETPLEFIIPYGEMITLHLLGSTPDDIQGVRVNSSILREAIMDHISKHKMFDTNK